jgi:GxxExxY protein
LTEIARFTKVEPWGIHQAALWACDTAIKGFEVDAKFPPTPNRIQNEEKCYSQIGKSSEANFKPSQCGPQSYRNPNQRESSSRLTPLLKVDLNFLTESVIGAAYEVSNILGAGFLEKLYERVLKNELALRGISVQSQAVFPVTYKGLVIGEYTADLVVENYLIVELKCVDRFAPTHLAQCLSYLHASGLPLALLLNFQHRKVECRRLSRPD